MILLYLDFRWKERFFILTNDYFHCFKKGSFKVTEMGEFIFKVPQRKLSPAPHARVVAGEAELDLLGDAPRQARLPHHLPQPRLGQGGPHLPAQGGGAQGMVPTPEGECWKILQLDMNIYILVSSEFP